MIQGLGDASPGWLQWYLALNKMRSSARWETIGGLEAIERVEGKRICHEIRNRRRFMKVKVWNFVDEPPSGIYQLGTWHTEWQTVQDGTDLGCTMGPAPSQGGAVSEKCTKFFLQCQASIFRRKVTLLIIIIKLCLLNGFYSLATRRWAFMSGYICWNAPKAAKKCKILLLVYISFVLVFQDTEGVEILLILCNHH